MARAGRGAAEEASVEEVEELAMVLAATALPAAELATAVVAAKEDRENS